MSDKRRKKLEKFSKYNDSETEKFFRKAKYGNIVVEYPKEYEENIYAQIAKLLHNKYPNFCNEDEIVQVLSSYGHIYTAQMEKGIGDGIYHIDSGNILVYTFLNRLNKTLVHEVIHKLGYLRLDDGFESMPEIYKEAGAELLSNSILEGPLCREMILGRMRVRCVGVQPRYLTATALVNQLNMVVGGSLLERSMIEGKNYLEPAIKELIGEKDYETIFRKMQEICSLEKKYWQGKQNEKHENYIYKEVAMYQNMVMKKIFDSRVKNVKTQEDAGILLDSLMNFSDFRVKFYAPRERDVDFEEYFMQMKESLEAMFDTKFQITDISDDWENKYPFIKLDSLERAREQDEREKINQLAEKNKIGFWQRLFRKPKAELPASSEEYKFIEQVDFTVAKQETTNIKIGQTITSYEEKEK